MATTVPPLDITHLAIPYVHLNPHQLARFRFLVGADPLVTETDDERSGHTRVYSDVYAKYSGAMKSTGSRKARKKARPLANPTGANPAKTMK